MDNDHHPPARPYAHLSAQAFSFATPQLQCKEKQRIKASMQLQSNASRRFPPPAPLQLKQKLSQSYKGPPSSSRLPKKGRSTLIAQRIQPSGFIAFCLKKVLLVDSWLGLQNLATV